MKKEKIVKEVGAIKEHASRAKDEAVKTVDSLKNALQTGIDTSKSILQKAAETLNKKGIRQGLDVTSKGVDLVAKGARLASRGAETVAHSMEKASKQIKKAGTKLKDTSKSD